LSTTTKSDRNWPGLAVQRRRRKQFGRYFQHIPDRCETGDSENAGVENTGGDCKGGNHRSGKRGTWKESAKAENAGVDSVGGDNKCIS